MKRFLAVATLAIIPTAAQAGVGLTWFTGGSGGVSISGTTVTYTAAASLPSIDYSSEGWVVQVHALDLVDNLASKDLLLSGNVFKTIQRKKVNEDIGGVVQAGGGLAIYAPDFDFGTNALNAEIKLRMGAQTQKGAGFGIYVVPGLGLDVVSSNVSLAVSGQLQISAWMN